MTEVNGVEKDLDTQRPTKPVAFGPTGQVVYERTYSRVKPDGEREVWPETVRRVVDGNLGLVDERHQFEGEREALIEMMEDFRIIPAGRHLWASGVPGRQYLFNCFSGDTMVHTRAGVLPIKKLAGQTVEVLSEGGVYRSAEFDYYGQQALYKVTLARGEELFATADHQWVVVQPDATRRVPTTRLAGKRIPFNPAPRPEEDRDYNEGFAHGVVYGDGSRSSETSCMVHLFGTKRELADRVSEFSRRPPIEHGDRTYVGTLPSHWKNLPSETAGRSYWRGFVNGLIATDGAVSKGSVVIDQSDSEALAQIRTGAMWAGYVPTGIKTTRVVSPYTGEHAPSYRLTIRGWSVSPEDIVRSDQADVFGPREAETRTVRVVSVEPTGRVEGVFCAVEPETHTITVGSGVLTGQCHVSGWGEDPAEHFEFTFLRLMEGGGVGANYSNRLLDGYSVVEGWDPYDRAEFGVYPYEVHIVCDPGHQDYEKMKDAGLLSEEYTGEWTGAFEVEDSREGWSEALTDLISTYYRPAKNQKRVFDVSRVRPEGARLKTFGGRASGPLPLARMLHEVADVMNACIGQKLDGLSAMMIDHAIAKCVVSGGNRRSARMSIMHWNDPQVHDFIKIKQLTGEHWTTNISVEVDDLFWSEVEYENSIAKDVLHEISTGMLGNGEPGFWNSDLSNVGEPNPVQATNPCGEIALEPFENCNLGHVNLAAFIDQEGLVDFESVELAHRLMTRFLMRATYGDVNDPKQAAVLARNRRIGVGHLGVASALAMAGQKYSEAPDGAFPDQLAELARVVDAEAAAYAHQLRVPVPVKTRTVAPTGTIAKMPGVSEGIHPIFSKYFVRRIRFSDVDPDQRATVERYREQGYGVEPCQYAPETTVVSLPTKDSLVAEVEARYGTDEIVESAADLGLEDMLRFQAMYQESWADNAVSYTVNVDPDKYSAAELADALMAFGPALKGATVFPEASMPQAPYERISKAEYGMYEDWQQSVADGVDEACANGGCPVK